MNEAPGALGTPPGRSVASPHERDDTVRLLAARRATCQRERPRRPMLGGARAPPTFRVSQSEPRASLLLDDLDLERSGERWVQLDRHLYRAEAFDGIGQLHAPAIELHTDALERFLDVLARDRAPHAIFLARRAFDLHGDGAELRLELLGVTERFGRFGRGSALEALGAGEVDGRGRHR